MKTAHLPTEFIERIEALLGAGAPEFFAHYAEPAEAGLRFNPLKAGAAELCADLPFELEPIPWSPHGCRLLGADSPPGLHPYHAAGLYYLQEPAAQAVAEILDPQPGERVLDLAAAPGGKTTHIAGMMKNQGLLLANDIRPKRVRDLARNLERWGARNVLIANETPERLANRLPGFFDRVLLDAPCSGEGMFRKMPAAIKDWSPEFVRSCAARQTDILHSAAQLVRPGGRLCYATCTFAREENEAVIARFLNEHPDFHLVTPSWRPGFARGLPPFDAPGTPTPVRLWPHLSPGEGHFIALLGRSETPSAPALAPNLHQSSPRARTALAPNLHQSSPRARTALAPNLHQSSPRARPALRRLLPLWERFARQNLAPGFEIPVSRLHLVKSYLYALPEPAPELHALRWVRPGLWLGSFKKDRFEPAHALAMALRPGEAIRSLELPLSRVEPYLRRETLPAEGEDGWTHVLLDGRCPLGWGKVVRGRLKNHYPKELRIF